MELTEWVDINLAMFNRVLSKIRPEFDQQTILMLLRLSHYVCLCEVLSQQVFSSLRN